MNDIVVVETPDKHQYHLGACVVRDRTANQRPWLLLLRVDLPQRNFRNVKRAPLQCGYREGVGTERLQSNMSQAEGSFGLPAGV